MCFHLVASRGVRPPALTGLLGASRPPRGEGLRLQQTIRVLARACILGTLLRVDLFTAKGVGLSGAEALLCDYTVLADGGGHLRRSSQISMPSAATTKQLCCSCHHFHYTTWCQVLAALPIPTTFRDRALWRWALCGTTRTWRMRCDTATSKGHAPDSQDRTRARLGL